MLSGFFLIIMKVVPNLLLFCGSGRNIGKTALLCPVISHNKENYKIAAIKISPNFHSTHQSGILIEKGDGYHIYQETEISDKDTSLFLQAGAEVSYYIETEDEFIEKAFNLVHQIIGKDLLIVCESGKLANHVKPGLMVFIDSTSKKQTSSTKKTNKQLADLIIDVSEGKLKTQIDEINQKIMVEKGEWKLK
jgi:hypothetical protein